MNDIFNSIGSSGPIEEKKKSDDTTGIFVSLYLIVLAFFVVMNSISNQDQNKVDAATESVTRAFKNPFEPEADFVDLSANEAAVTPNDEFHDQISGVFASLIGFDGKFPTKGGNIVKVHFNPNDLFEHGSSDFRPNQQKFLQQLSGFLAGGRLSERRVIDVVISSGESLPRGPKYWQDTDILRAGAFVHQLKKMGVAENQLSIGIVKGAKDRMTLTFHNRDLKGSVQGLTGHDTMRQPENFIDDLPVREIPDRRPLGEIPDARDNEGGAF